MFKFPRIFFFCVITCTIQVHAVTVGDYGSFTPDPTRFNSEVAGLTVGDLTHPPLEGGIVCTGSSSMKMWHPRIEADLPGLSVIPRGFGGSQFSDLIYFAETLILKYKPRAVVVYEGDNEVANGKSAATILADLKFLVDLCRTVQPDMRFYVVAVKPNLERWHLWPETVEANTVMKAFCDETEGVIFIDVATPMLNAEGDLRTDIFMPDGIHLNSAGYDIWAGAIAPVLLASERVHELGAGWAGFPLDDNLNADTGDWLGWVYVGNAPWVYVYTLGEWVYLPEDYVSDTGSWMYLARPSSR